MSNVNKGIKIFAWITGGLILILACLFIPVMKSYLYDPVITEQTVCYVYPKWNDAQLDSALHSVIPDEKSIPRVKRLLSFYKFDPDVRVGAYRLHAGMTARQMALKLSRGSQSPYELHLITYALSNNWPKGYRSSCFFRKRSCWLCCTTIVFVRI